MKKILSSRRGRQFATDRIYRTKILLYQGLIMNLIYVVMKLSSGIAYRSTWLVDLGIYYFFLAVLRLMLIHYVRHHETKEDLKAEHKRYRSCAYLLMIMNLVLVGIVIMIVFNNEGYQYPGMLIYAMAAYTFYAVINAVINVFRFRKEGSPVMSAAKIINLTAALVSMLSLETAMISQFGGNDNGFRFTMTAVSGFFVCAGVLAMATYMILHANEQLKKDEIPDK